MADFSRPLHRNHGSSAILSKKLSNVHSFSGKSMYDDVFATPSKLKAPIFSSRVEDYSEIFNSYNSKTGSSIPVLDIPIVDKRDGLVSVPNSESDYSKIFGGFNDTHVNINGDCSSGETWIPAGTKAPSDTSVADFLEKNQVPSQDATYQSVNDKKEFKMFYNKTNIGINDGTNGTTHVAQLHAVPGFTCIVDEITPLQKTEGIKPVPTINDVSPTSDIREGLMEGKHCRKASSNLPDIDSKDAGDRNGSYSDGVQFNAYDIEVNADGPKVTPPSSPTPNLGNNNNSSKKATSGIDGTHKSDEFESVTDESPVFSDEEVDANSAAAVSAAAVRKAIEVAQASIRLAKEAMERKKGLQSSVKHSSKNGLKVQEVREIKIAAEAKRFKEKKGQKISKSEKTRIQSFPCKEGQNARTDQEDPNLKDWKNSFPPQGAAGDTNVKQSEVFLVMQNKKEGQRNVEAAKLSCDFINSSKYVEKTLVYEEDEDIKKETMQTLDGSDWEGWKTPVDTFELLHSDGENLEVVEAAFEVEQLGRKLNALKEGAQESENHCNKLRLAEIIHEHEEIEKKLEVAQKQVETEGKLKASQEQGKCEEELKEFQKPAEYENESTTKKWEHDDYEKGLKESQTPLETEMKLKRAHEGKTIEMIIKEDYESEGKERKIKELLEQEIFERRVKEASECFEDEKKPTVPCEWEVNKNLEDAHTGQDYERELKRVQDQELRVDDRHGGKSSENIWQEDFEREGYEKVDVAWKQEENDNILEQAGQKEGNEREGEDAYNWEDGRLKQRHPCQREEDEKNLKTIRESLTNMVKNDQKTYDASNQAKSENPCGAGETYKDKENNDNVEATQDVLAHEESGRMVGATKASSEPEEIEEGSNVVEEASELADKASSEPEEIEEGSNAVEEASELADKEMFGKACLDPNAIDGDDDQMENYVDDVSEAFMINDDEVNESKDNANELKAVDAANGPEDKEMLETARLAEDDFEQNDDENNIKDERDAFLVDDSALSLGEANINTEHEQIDQNNKESGFACNVGADVEKLTHELGEINENTEEAKAAFDQEEEINQIKAAYVDKLLVKNEKKMEESELNGVYEVKGNILEAAQEIKTSQNTEQMKENLNKTRIREEREAKERMHEDVILEKEHLRSRHEAKEKEKERERERVAVERAIREARERAFAEARERAEKAALEKATAEARQRVNTNVRERLDKAAAGANSLAAKVSMEAKLKAERAAVERATAEARERALEKALSGKAAFEAREQRNDGDQYQGAGPSSSFKHSNSYDVPSATERFDDGARTESAERCKARLEKHQRIVERAAKALEEKNNRDLLAQKEQAERNRFAEALDSDVNRWSSGKAGNLRALLSTLQYILGPNSGWQPIPLTDIVANSAVKKAYRKATLFVHPDKLQQRGASIQEKYICEKVFDLLKEAWNKFNSEER